METSFIPSVSLSTYDSICGYTHPAASPSETSPKLQPQFTFKLLEMLSNLK